MLLGLLFLLVPASSFAGVAVSITIAPPVLPVYTQPPCPVEGYIWTPGYWAWGPDGYYWVPGVWVAPPQLGLLWTPGYWGWGGGVYMWHAGYWGRTVGFYGGVNYGFGYPGAGFVGGIWVGNAFRYNTAVVSVNRTVVRNVYVDHTVIHNTTVVNRTSYNGGTGGLTMRPTQEQMAAGRERHFEATQAQVSHQTAMRQDRNQLAAVNRGNPQVTSMERPNGRQFGTQGRAVQPVNGAENQNRGPANNPQPRTQYPNSGPGNANRQQGYQGNNATNRPQATQYPNGNANRQQSTQYPNGGSNRQQYNQNPGGNGGGRQYGQPGAQPNRTPQQQPQAQPNVNHQPARTHEAPAAQHQSNAPRQQEQGHQGGGHSGEQHSQGHNQGR
jgi:hypothetical protein